MSDLDRSIERLKRNIAVGGYDGADMTGMFRTIDDLVAEREAFLKERDQLLAEKAQANFAASHPDAMKKMYRINQRLREALEKIAKMTTGVTSNSTNIFYVTGPTEAAEIARTALGGEGNE